MQILQKKRCKKLQLYLETCEKDTYALKYDAKTTILLRNMPQRGTDTRGSSLQGHTIPW